ncbi:MAG: 4Fe-4S binding protein, partial [Dehalococcoidia bacterium]|nr:4Fe-4S binding protein [Dehalococcoidia bacterium]
MPVKIDKNSCTGCQVCSWVCPGNIIRIDSETNTASAIFNKECPSCGLCEEYCPFECIEVVRAG